MHPLFFFAYKDIKRQRKPVALIILVIVLGIVNITFTLGLINGMNEYSLSQAVDLTTGHVTVIPYEGYNYIENLNDVELKLKYLPDVVSIIPRLEDDVYIINKNKTYAYTVEGIKLQVERESTPLEKKIIEGNYISAKDEMLFGKDAAKYMDIAVGDSVSIKFSNGVEKRVHVVGIVSAGSWRVDWKIFADYDLVSEAININDKASKILIKIDEPDKADAIKTKIKQNGIGNAKSWQELSEEIKQQSMMWSTIGTVISGVAIIAASVGLAILIYINILHRIKQIGVMKAIGAKSIFISGVFLTEIMLIVFIGIVLGFIISFLIVGYFEANPIYDAGSDRYIHIAYPVDIILPTIMAILLFSLISGIYPIMKASKLDVIDVLKNE